MQYGDLTLGQTTPTEDFLFSDISKRKTEMAMPSSNKGIRISSRDVKLHYLKLKAEKSNSIEDINEYENEIQQVARSLTIFEFFRTELKIKKSKRSKPIDYNCLRFTLEVYKDFCGFNERDLEFIHSFSLACSMNIKEITIYEALKKICKLNLK